MSLREKQSAFALAVAHLILEATRRGYDVTLGEAWRSPQEAARLAATGAGISRSLHSDRLAIDLNLFKDGVYLDNTAEYTEIGAWWEAQSTPEITCAWGGRFPRADGNHFSFAHDGRK